MRAPARSATAASPIGGAVRLVCGAGALTLAAAFAPALAPTAAFAQSGGATSVQVQALEEEVRRLNGRVEELEHRLRTIASDAAQRINDLEYRLTELEGGDTSLVGDPVPLGQPSGGGSRAPVAVSEKVALDDAKAAIAAGRPGEAQQGLIQFLAQDPDGPLTAEAEHYLGQTYYMQGDMRRAAQTFLTNFSAYPDGAKAPDSMLMLGKSLSALGQRAEACSTLQELGRRFPSSQAAAEGSVELAGLGCS